MNHRTGQPSGGMDALVTFVQALDTLIDRQPAESALLAQGGALLGQLVACDDWLPEPLARPSSTRYQQYALHVDPLGRFSVVSFVWGPGQSTPIHDHTVWGLIGMLRGSEISQGFDLDPDGKPVVAGPARRLQAGDVEPVSPNVGDIHQVSNAHADRVSISIHVYGADIGRVERSIYSLDGTRKPFVSGYSNLLSTINSQPA